MTNVVLRQQRRLYQRFQLVSCLEFVWSWTVIIIVSCSNNNAVVNASSSSSSSHEPIPTTTYRRIATNSCHVNCGPFGTCEFQTTHCRLPNSTAADDNRRECAYQCQCEYGYTGDDCSLPYVTCNGTFATNITENFDTAMDHTNALCYNGGTCQLVVSTARNDENQYQCDCNTTLKDDDPANDNNQVSFYSGYDCRYAYDHSCVIDQEFSSVSYCVNGGECRRYVSPQQQQQHVPCICGAKWEGRHCQYASGTAPTSELIFVQEQIDLENQRLRDKDELENDKNKDLDNSIENDSNTIPTNQQKKNDYSLYGFVALTVICGLVIVLYGVYYVVRIRRRRRDVAIASSTDAFRFDDNDDFDISDEPDVVTTTNKDKVITNTATSNVNGSHATTNNPDGGADDDDDGIL